MFEAPLISRRRARHGAMLAVPLFATLTTAACQEGQSARETLAAGADTVKGTVVSAWEKAINVVSPGVELPESDPLLSTRKPTGFDYASLAQNRDRDLAQERASLRGLIDAPALSDYLNDVLGKILAVAPEQNVPARVYVKDSNEINAAALPSAAIILPMGILRNIEYDDELAFVLGHELSHVLQRHHEADWYVTAQKHSLAAMELGFGIAQAYRHRFADQVENQLDDLMLANEATLMLSESLLAPAWTRGQEDEADVLGLDLMREAGYRPSAAFSVLAKLGEAEKNQTASGPAAGQRVVDYIGSRTETTGLRRYLDPKKLREAVEGAAKQAWAWVNRQLGRNHRTYEERKTYLSDYAERYKGPATGAMRPAPWSEEGRKAGRGAFGQHDARAMRAIFDNYELALQAEQALLDKHDAPGALRLARQAARPPLQHAAYPWVVIYDAQAAQRKRDAGRQELRQALASGEPALVIYYRMLDKPLTERKWEEASRLVEDARENVGDAPQILPLRVYLLARQQRKAEAVLLNTQCVLEYPDIAGALCKQALEGRDWQPRERIGNRP